MFSCEQIWCNIFKIILLLNCHTTNAVAYTNIHTRCPYGVAMCRAWCDKSGGCETSWFSPDSLACSVTRPLTHHSSFTQLAHKKDPPDCGGETCHAFVECITSRVSGARCVRPTDIRTPTMYLVKEVVKNSTLFRWGQNVDTEPLKQKVFPEKIKEMTYFPPFKCLLALLLTKEIGCIYLRNWTYKSFCENKNRRWFSVTVSRSLVFLLQNVESDDGWQSQVTPFTISNEKCEEQTIPFKTKTTIFDQGDSITADNNNNYLYFSGKCTEDHGQLCIYKSAKLFKWSEAFVVAFQVRRLVFDEIDKTLRFVSVKKVGSLLPNGTSVVNREVPTVLHDLLCTPEFLVLMGRNGMIVLGRDYSTVAVFRGTNGTYSTMTLAGED